MRFPECGIAGVGGLLTESWGAESRSPAPVFCEAEAMESIAPIFAVRDLDAAMQHYQRLSFAVGAYPGGGYGFASWHGMEIHLDVVPDDERRTSAAYLFVDADDLAAAWHSAGVKVDSPQDMEWGNTKAPLSTRTATSSALARRSGEAGQR
jgi:hypothetical protein